MLKAQFDMLARYNAFANQRLYDAAGALATPIIAPTMSLCDRLAR